MYIFMSNAIISVCVYNDTFLSCSCVYIGDQLCAAYYRGLNGKFSDIKLETFIVLEMQMSAMPVYVVLLVILSSTNTIRTRI